MTGYLEGSAARYLLGQAAALETSIAHRAILAEARAYREQREAEAAEAARAEHARQVHRAKKARRRERDRQVRHLLVRQALALVTGHQCSPRSAVGASSTGGERGGFCSVAILHDDPGIAEVNPAASAVLCR